ncbi:MAG: hypothetical protein KDB52_03555 [Solirubrobacterales bacterium]|nr:hypothetical protein [Solirubrobacterales bacterium]
MKTALKVIAIVSATLLTLVFIVILILATRPALLMGVGPSRLAHSIEKDQGTVFCQDLPEGWRCKNVDKGIEYDVNVDWMGCWKAEPRNGSGRLEGCIELGDIVTFD